MNFDNIGWGLQMMVLGMGIVFALLALLWALLVIILRFDREPAPPAVAEDTAGSGASVEAAAAQRAPSVDGMDGELVAAILVATLTHKAVRRSQAAPAMRSYWPGSLLYASRWVASGRARQNQNWQRRGG